MTLPDSRPSNDSDADDQLTLFDYLRIAQRRKWLIAAITVACTVLGASYGLTRTPQYQASALVRLDLDPSSLIDVGPNKWVDSRRVVENELLELQSTLMLRSVEDRLGYQPNLSASNDGTSDVVTLAVVGTDQDAVAQAANVYAEAFIELQADRNAQKFLSTGTRIEVLITAIDERIRVAESSSASSSEIEQLERQRSSYQEQLDALRLSADVTQGTNARLISSASRPAGPFSPNIGRTTLLALVAGLILGGGIAFLRETFDKRIRSREDLVRTLGDVAVLATVPRDSKAVGHRLVASIDTPQSVASEAYRTLRTSIQFAGLQSSVNRILLASADPGAGKTTTAVNLASVFTQQGRSVILIDADLRSPRVHEHFGIENNTGLTDVILGDIELNDALQTIDSLPGLQVLTTGPTPPNPTELLGAAVFPGAAKSVPEIIETLEQEGHIIIIDTAPVLPVADALLLTSYVDGVVMVVRAGDSEWPNVSGALDELERAGARILGAVFNDATEADGGYGYGYGYGADAPTKRRNILSWRPNQSRGAAKAPMQTVAAIAPGPGSKASPAKEQNGASNTKNDGAREPKAVRKSAKRRDPNSRPAASGPDQKTRSVRPVAPHAKAAEKRLSEPVGAADSDD